MRTSQTHPLQIAEVRPATSLGPGLGRIGLTFCPGKQQADAMTGGWARDLGLDLDAVAAWNAAAVLTLVEDHELVSLRVPHLGAEVAARHMDWLHLPIPDATAPDDRFEEALAQAGEGLRARLRAGFAVLVHCKGGLGRAGTIAARLMAELGCDPAEAVEAVRAARPGAIETQDQWRHVQAVRSVPEPQRDRAPAAIRNRAAGALLGLAVGDAIGTTLEFKQRDSLPRLTGMTGGGRFGLQPGQWTDDTAMALALVASLEHDPKLDEADLMRRFTAWWENGEYSCTGTCFDIGNTTREALARWQRSGDPFAGSTRPDTAGNGSLMRLAPVAIAHWRDQASRRDVAARQSRTTHAAAQAVDACVAFADLLAEAIAGEPRSTVLRPRAEAVSDAIATIMAGSWRDRRRDEIRSSGYVAHSLEAALWCVGRTASFADAVLLAANLADDADTTAAITGQLAGALYGLDGIPADWRKTVAWEARIVDMAQRLAG